MCSIETFFRVLCLQQYDMESLVGSVLEGRKC